MKKVMTTLLFTFTIFSLPTTASAEGGGAFDASPLPLPPMPILAKTKAKSNHNGLWVQVYKSCSVLSNMTPLPDDKVQESMCQKNFGEATVMNVKISSSGETIQYTDPNVIPSVLMWNASDRTYTGVGSSTKEEGKAKCSSVVAFETQTTGYVQDDCTVQVSTFTVKVRNNYTFKLD